MNNRKTMKKMIFVTLIAVLANILPSNGQAMLEDQNLLNGYKNIPQEGIFVHHNATLLFAGEQLYYKVYCLDVKSRKLSGLSKVGYVELVGEDKQPVFRHKIRLTEGLGQGDFFIPTSVPTGSYKLIGYTQWMKNAGQGHFFQSDLNIINPYRTIPEPYLAEKKPDSVATDSIQYAQPKTTRKQTEINQVGSNHISLSTDGSAFGKREEVTITLKGLDDASVYGN
jgi:hypothetical protein